MHPLKLRPYPRKSKKIAVHFMTGKPASYTTENGYTHEVSTTTRHGGYDVATLSPGGFIVPGSIATYSTLEKAIAEIERRAMRDYINEHGHAPDPELDA